MWSPLRGSTGVSGSRFMRISSGGNGRRLWWVRTDQQFQLRVYKTQVVFPETPYTSELHWTTPQCVLLLRCSDLTTSFTLKGVRKVKSTSSSSSSPSHWGLLNKRKVELLEGEENPGPWLFLIRSDHKTHSPAAGENPGL